MSRAVSMVMVAAFAAIAVAAPVKIVTKHIGGSSPGPSTAGGSPVVHMAGVKFSPTAIVVKRGTMVVFDNNDIVPHTVTEDSTGGVDSGLLGPGRAFRVVIDRRLVYHCTVHPFMKAAVELAG